MPLNDKQKKVVVAGAIAGVVIGGAALYLASRSKSQSKKDEDVDFSVTDKNKDAVVTKETPKPIATATKAAPVVADSAKSFQTVTSNTNSVTATTVSQKSSTSAPVFSNRYGAQNFPEFFCSVIPAEGWVASSDPAPMPNIGMIMFKKPEFDTMPESEVPGALPAVILTIEDVSVENLTVTELKEKSKQMAFQQIYQMSGGQFRPEVKIDTPQTNGVFEYTLEYSQSIPPFMDMRVSNLITIKNGLAYCFQLVANPQVFNQYRPAFIEMAKSVEIADAAPQPFAASPHVVNTINGISVKVPTSWSFMSTIAAGDRLVEFKSGSETKTEMITIYKNGPQGLDNFTEVSKKTIDGVELKDFKDTKKTRKVASYNGYSIVVAPLKISTSLIDEALIVAVLKSVVPTSASNSRRFINTTDGYEIPITEKSSLVCSKIGCGTVIYAPAGMEAMQSGEEAPTGTLRVGNPSNDKSCASSLAEWRERLSSEEGIGSITNTTLAGLDAITFTTTEMTEVGPGMRSEVKSKVVIAILSSGDTLLIRWECPTGAWPRYQKQLNTILEEITILDQ